MGTHEVGGCSFVEGKESKKWMADDLMHTEIGFLWEDSFEYKFFEGFQLLDPPHALGDLFLEDDLPLSSLVPA